MKSLFIITEILLTSITFIEGVDITTKVISVSIAAVVGFFAVRHYMKQTRLTNLQIDKLEKEKQSKL